MSFKGHQKGLGAQMGAHSGTAQQVSRPHRLSGQNLIAVEGTNYQFRKRPHISGLFYFPFENSISAVHGRSGAIHAIYAVGGTSGISFSGLGAYGAPKGAPWKTPPAPGEECRPLPVRKMVNS